MDAQLKVIFNFCHGSTYYILYTEMRLLQLFPPFSTGLGTGYGGVKKFFSAVVRLVVCVMCIVLFTVCCIVCVDLCCQYGSLAHCVT